MKKYRKFTVGEEISHSITHGIGALLGIAALIVLIVLSSKQKNAWKIVSFSIYGASLFLLYLSSTLFHSLSFTKSKEILKKLDLSMIYILIAGTYTPILLVPMRGTLGWILFGIIWTLAIIGIVFKWISVGKNKVIPTLLYVIMGWIIIFPIKQVLTMIPFGLFIWLISGGVAYTIGGIFHLWRKQPYAHFIWHLFVLTGSTLHFLGILIYIL